MRINLGRCLLLVQWRLAPFSVDSFRGCCSIERTAVPLAVLIKFYLISAFFSFDFLSSDDVGLFA
jgi:hypothetical protein